ncbi:unnamed protein product [Ilex paraguariensis]|uniref:Uncharacterized protein n=1 Tax=Ilex paraguariensis TaxID=185542 RepID=A0ABC8U412_9AQUA
MSTSYSPSRSPASSRFLLGGVGAASRLRSSSLKKQPEPLRRAVADCLSSSTTSQHSTSSALASEPSRTLRVRIHCILVLNFVFWFSDLVAVEAMQNEQFLLDDAIKRKGFFCQAHMNILL